MKSIKQLAWALLVLLIAGSAAYAGEADLAIPDLSETHFDRLGGIDGWHLMLYGAFVIVGTLGISLYQLAQIHKQPAHKSMLAVAEIIFQTCKTYLIQQGKFLLMLFGIIALAMTYY
ncbi:MAG: sodium-translocating pyrophosphatase, partial [Planctomycetes bacterium]|nr:sodium-translocating pyrophosphatase [Planctomycetota bacterium]